MAKILLLTKHFIPEIGGTEIYCKNILSFLGTKKNIDVNVITFKQNNNDQQTAKISFGNNIKITRINLPAPPRTIKVKITNRFIPFFIKNLFIFIYLFITHVYSFIYLSIFLLLYLRKNKVDKIYTVGGVYIALIGALSSAIFHISLISHFHADFQFNKRNLFIKYLANLLFKKCNYVLVNSLDSKIDLLKFGIQEKKIIIIHNWVDLKLFKPLSKNSCRKRWNLPNDKFIVLYSGRLSYEKHVDLLLEVINLINKRNNNFIFLFIGTGNRSNQVNEIEKKYDNVMYYGEKLNIDLPLYINVADLFWGASDINYISISTIEALACGIPVIIPEKMHPVFGLNKYQQKIKKSTLPGEVGFLVPDNYTSIAEKLISMDKRKESLLKMSKNCQRFVCKNYGYDNAEKVYQILQNV